MSADAIEKFKEAQKQGWAHFAPLQSVTTPTAARLAKFAGVQSGQRVLDVACGTGVVAITAARIGANVTGLDLTPELLERARENSGVAEVDVDWREGDVEALPFQDGAFDVVLSQFGHMFAPRPEVAIREMLRVLKPSGTIAFSTWPPELLIGRSFTLVGSYMPPPPTGVSPPPPCGDANIVRSLLGTAVRDTLFHPNQALHEGIDRIDAASFASKTKQIFDDDIEIQCRSHRLNRDGILGPDRVMLMNHAFWQRECRPSWHLMNFAIEHVSNSPRQNFVSFVLEQMSMRRNSRTARLKNEAHACARPTSHLGSFENLHRIALRQCSYFVNYRHGEILVSGCRSGTRFHDRKRAHGRHDQRDFEVEPVVIKQSVREISLV